MESLEIWNQTWLRMSIHNVYNTPLANVLAVENALATRTNPNPDDERVVVLL